MKRLLIAAATLSLMAGPVFAQTSGTSNDESVNSGSSTMNNNDAALPGGTESNTTGAMGTSGTTGAMGSTGDSSTVIVPQDNMSSGSSQTMDPSGATGSASETTPSGGVVPGQTPE